MQALVTGATGFIGGHLTQALLAQGWGVRCSIRGETNSSRLPPRVETAVVGDLRQASDWAPSTRGIDVVFHLAGKAHDVAAASSDSDYAQVNYEATRQLVLAAQASGVKRFVFFSSVKAAGGDTPYARSKRDAERAVIEASTASAMMGVCLRLALVYGPGQKGNLSRLLWQIDWGLFPALRWVDNRRSMVHVENVIQAALLAAQSPRAAGQTYAVTDAEPYSTATLCRLIREGLGKPQGWDIPEGLLQAFARLGDVLSLLRKKPFFFDSETYRKLCGDEVYSCEKLVSELAYLPRADLRSALPGIIGFYRGQNPRPPSGSIFMP